MTVCTVTGLGLYDNAPACQRFSRSFLSTPNARPAKIVGALEMKHLDNTTRPLRALLRENHALAAPRKFARKWSAAGAQACPKASL